MDTLKVSTNPNLKTKKNMKVKTVCEKLDKTNLINFILALVAMYIYKDSKA